MSPADALRHLASGEPAPRRPGSPRWHRDSPMAWLQGSPDETDGSYGGLRAFGASAGSWTPWSPGLTAGPHPGGAVRLNPRSRARTPGRPGTHANLRDGFGAGAGASAGPTALVVDDDYRSTLAFTALLERNQFEVVSAPSGYTALDALDDRDDIGIVVMDIMMSVMDGYATMAAIRRRPRFAQLPIIAVTAKADDGHERQRCLAAGASDFLPKPIDPPSFLSTMASWLTVTAATPSVQTSVSPC